MAHSFKLQAYRYFEVTFPAQYVAHVEINRPEKMNAFTEPMWLEMRTVFDALSLSSDVRAIVFSGSGSKAFTTGLDVQAASQTSVLAAETQNLPLDGARTATMMRRHVAEFQDCISAIERCEKPVICVMHGYALGLAIDLSTCADVRICSDDTRFAVKEVDIGLAADIGTLTRLPKVVGCYSWVKDVCLSARIFGAAEALKVGLVSGVYPGKQTAIEEGIRWAKLVAEKSPVAVQGTKELLNWSRDHNVQDGLRYTGVWNSAALQSRDVSAAMLSGMQKTRPVFEKL